MYEMLLFEQSLEKTRVYSNCPQHVAKRYDNVVRNVVSLGVWFRSYSIYQREYVMSVGVALRKKKLNSLPFGDEEADLMKDINYVNMLCKEPPTTISIDVEVYKSRTADLCYMRKLGLDNTDDYS